MKNPEKQMLQNLLLTLIGLFLIVANLFLGFDGTLITFSVGVGLTVGGLIALLINMDTMEKLRKQYEKRMQHANEGALWIWAVCLLAIVVLALAWLPLSMVSYMMIDILEGIFAFPPQARTSIDLLKSVIAWFLILMLLGLLLWAYVNSQRKEMVTYPYD